MTVGLLTMVIFGDLGGYFFENVRDKGQQINIRPMAICYSLLASNLIMIEK